ncbi:MAG: sialidase family protein [Acidimicrobiales bacterium]
MAGVILVVAGVAALLTASFLDRPAPKLLGGNRPVNASATDPLDVNAQNSPVLRRNPKDQANLVVASRIDSPRFSCALHASVDGGATWIDVPIPVPEGPGVTCFAPDAAFGADGTLYLSFTSFGQVSGQGTVPDAIWLVTSKDGGRTLSSPVQAGGPMAFHVRLAADRRTAGRLYLAWVQGAGTSSWGFATVGNPVMVARSDDGGATWRPPVRVSPATRERVVAPSIEVGRDGEVHVAYLDVGDDVLDYAGAHEGKGGEPYYGAWAIVAARSSDKGVSWRDSVVDERLAPTQRFLVLFPPGPSVAVDGRTVYVAFEDGRLGDADVWLWKSTNGGEQWQRPKRVNDTLPRDGTAQYLPELAVGPNGRLDVVYYDRRTDFQNRMNEVSLQSSYDRGKTFGPRLRLSDRAFDSGVGVGSERGMAELGNRLGLVSTSGRVLSVWADTRGGTPSNGKQDLASGIAVVPPQPALRQVLRVGGAVASMSGLVVLIAAGFLRRARRMSARPADFSPVDAPYGDAEPVRPAAVSDDMEHK